MAANDFPLARFQRAGFSAGQIATFQAQWANLSFNDQVAEALVIEGLSDYQVALITALPSGSGAPSTAPGGGSGPLANATLDQTGRLLTSELPLVAARTDRMSAFLKQPSALVRSLALPTAIGQPEIRVVSLGSPSSGNWTITMPAAFGGGTTASIAFNANAVTIQQAINAIGGAANGSMSIFGPPGGPWVFKTTTNIAGPLTFTINNVSLVGATITNTLQQQGAAGGPTFARGADNGGSTIANSALIPYSDNRFRITGTRTTTTQFASAIAPVDPSPMGTFTGFYTTMRIEFETEASQFDIVMTTPNGQTAAFRLWVNGQPHAPQPIDIPFPIVGNPIYFNVNFGSRGYRQIIIESEGQFVFRGVNIAKTETIWYPQTPLGPRVMWIGDSGSWGGASGSVLLNFPHNACRLMGWGDIWLEAVPGSGYITPSGANSTFVQRMADAAAIAPDILVISGTINDPPGQGAGAACQSCINTALGLSKVPRILLLGPSRAGNLTAGDLAIAAEIKAAAAAVGITTTPSALGMYLDSTAPHPPITGTGQAGGTYRRVDNLISTYQASANLVGDGACDLYSFDQVHPAGPDAHIMYSRDVAGALQQSGFAFPT